MREATVVRQTGRADHRDGLVYRFVQRGADRRHVARGGSIPDAHRHRRLVVRPGGAFTATGVIATTIGPLGVEPIDSLAPTQIAGFTAMQIAGMTQAQQEAVVRAVS